MALKLFLCSLIDTSEQPVLSVAGWGEAVTPVIWACYQVSILSEMAEMVGRKPALGVNRLSEIT